MKKILIMIIRLLLDALIVGIASISFVYLVLSFFIGIVEIFIPSLIVFFVTITIVLLTDVMEGPWRYDPVVVTNSDYDYLTNVYGRIGGGFEILNDDYEAIVRHRQSYRSRFSAKLPLHDGRYRLSVEEQQADIKKFLNIDQSEETNE